MIESTASARKVAVCDLDGVLYLSDVPIPGSSDAVRRLRAAGWLVLFCTNNATRTPEEVSNKLDRVTGLDVEPTDVLTSAVAVARQIHPGQRVMVVGNEALRGAITEMGGLVVDQDPDVVVCGLDMRVGYERLRDASVAVQDGATFLASNLDTSFPTPDAQWPGAGALAAVITATTGVSPIAAGKPHPPMRALIKQRITDQGTSADTAVHVIGDRPDTDIALATHEPGWTSTLVLSGVTRNPHTAVPQPDRVAPDLVEAVDDLLEKV